MAEGLTPIEIFCCYSRADEKWLWKLESHLSSLMRQGLISLWYDRLILPGTNWVEIINQHLSTAPVILLLVSSDFLASDYCSSVEMKRALEREKAGEARVVPILVRPVDWKKAPFAHLQALPANAQPIVSWPDQEAALADVTAGIRRVIEDGQMLTASVPRAALPARATLPTNSELSPGPTAPQALFSSPGVPYVPRGLFRRKVVGGLAGLVVVGVAGGFLWLELGRNPAPKIMSVSPITPALEHPIIITGSGFGTQPPLTNTTSNYLNLQDITRRWAAGYHSNSGTNVIGVTVPVWTDNRIEITGFSIYDGDWTFQLGDQVLICVWNPQTNVGPAFFTTTVTNGLASTPTPASTPAPKITSVSPIRPAQDQTIIITGSGFGTQSPSADTMSNYLYLQDITRQWAASMTVAVWTDKQIGIVGFSGYGGDNTFHPGDQVVICVWNSQTNVGPALLTTTVVG